jgi:hypothetical protein
LTFSPTFFFALHHQQNIDLGDNIHSIFKKAKIEIFENFGHLQVIADNWTDYYLLASKQFEMTHFDKN